MSERGYPITVTILGDEKTFEALGPLLERASSRRIVADVDGDEDESTWLELMLKAVLGSMLKAAPPAGRWLVIVDLDSDFCLDDGGVLPEVEESKRDRGIAKLITVLDEIKLANLDPKGVLPDRILTLHVRRDKSVEVLEVIKEAIQA